MVNNSDRPFTDPASVSHECNYLSTRSVEEIDYSLALTSISLNEMPLLYEIIGCSAVSISLSATITPLTKAKEKCWTPLD